MRILLLFVILLSGCSMTPEQKVDFGTKLGVMRIIEDSNDPSLRAEKTRQVIKNIVVILDSGNLLTMSELRGVVKDQVGYDTLKGSEKLVIDALMIDLSNRVDVGVVDIDKDEKIREFLATIEEGIILSGY